MVDCVVGPPPFPAAPPRPPLGLMPKEIHGTIRALDIMDAMERYAMAGMAVPAEWVAELKEIYPWRRNL